MAEFCIRFTVIILIKLHDGIFSVAAYIVVVCLSCFGKRRGRRVHDAHIETQIVIHGINVGEIKQFSHSIPDLYGFVVIGDRAHLPEYGDLTKCFISHFIRILQVGQVKLMVGACDGILCMDSGLNGYGIGMEQQQLLRPKS